MTVPRLILDNTYWMARKFLFRFDPEFIHDKFTSYMKALHKKGWDKFLFDNPANYTKSRIQLSNAAGMNKNGDIHPLTMKYIGFERMVIGTVTGEQCDGNDLEKRIWRFKKQEALVNDLGLPGIGAKGVAENIMNYGMRDMPLTINVMPTPKYLKNFGQEAIDDIKTTMEATRYLQHVDRFELNISCPNTGGKEDQIDARNKYIKHLPQMLEVSLGMLKDHQRLDVKISPDSDLETVDQQCEIFKRYDIAAIVATNTSKDKSLIKGYPGSGGVSGVPLYKKSLAMQKLIHEKLPNHKIIGVGGIKSTRRVHGKLEHGAIEIQVFTAMIFRGPYVIRRFREYYKAT